MAPHIPPDTRRAKDAESGRGRLAGSSRGPTCPLAASRTADARPPSSSCQAAVSAPGD